MATADTDTDTSDNVALTAGNCPVCGCRGFVLGPVGGLAQNIECANVACRSRFNVSTMSGIILFAQRLGRGTQNGNPAWPSEPAGGPVAVDPAADTAIVREIIALLPDDRMVGLTLLGAATRMVSRFKR